ncbi:NACHT domain-containing protein [Proteus mirabilis]|uniref:NACHT domain-containing protein n=1 Tax=Proteus mirabilis TaxID=584 RepID=UPI003F4A9EA4
MITIENAVELFKPWAFKIFEEKVLPFVFCKGADVYNRKKNLYKLKGQMSDYLAKTRAQCSVINSLAFPNVLKKVNDIYIPLTLSMLDSREEREHTIKRGDLFLSEFNNILIIDNAGMGKSTLMKKIVIDTIDHSEYIPIYIELRTLTNNPIEEQINKLLGFDDVNDSDSILKKIPFIYFFDGVDEIPFDLKNDLIKKIKVFSDEMSNSKIIITSRPDQSLLELHSFNRFKIKPLEIEQSYDLIKLYDINLVKRGNRLILSNKLITEIKLMREKENNTILEFLTTPLYVSLLFCSYRYKPVIPRRKDLFYSQVFEALFETHDLSKETGYVREKSSGLDITDFSIILRRLAFWCLKNNGKLEFSRAELESILTNITEKLKGVNVKPISFINDLTYSVPLFIKEGALYRWSHKSLMEYFSAEFICIEVKDKRDDLLLKLYESGSAVKYKNIIELCSDIDYASFRKSILRKCLTEYFEHLEKLEDLDFLDDCNKEIWASISFFSDLKLLLTPYSNANLGDLNILDNVYVFEESDFSHSSFENNFIGFREYITHITYPVSLKNTVFDIIRLKNNEYFFKEKDYYNRLSLDSLKIPENVMISTNSGYVKGYSNDIIPDIISILLQFRHTLTIPVIYKSLAMKALDDIVSDTSNGVNDLLEGFD